jgi:hypothetical protein
MRDHWDNGAGIVNRQSGIEAALHADTALDGRFYDLRLPIYDFRLYENNAYVCTAQRTGIAWYGIGTIGVPRRPHCRGCPHA